MTLQSTVDCFVVSTVHYAIENKSYKNQSNPMSQTFHKSIAIQIHLTEYRFFRPMQLTNWHLSSPRRGNSAGSRGTVCPTRQTVLKGNGVSSDGGSLPLFFISRKSPCRTALYAPSAPIRISPLMTDPSEQRTRTPFPPWCIERTFFPSCIRS